MGVLANFLVLCGAVIFIVSLAPIRHLYRRLPSSLSRSAWTFLSALIAFFFCGYLAYAWIFWGQAESLADMVVPAIFCSGAIFVLVVCSLSARTADDVRRLCHLEHENITDPLMGIYNRRHLDECLRQEAAKARRYGLDLSILLLDVDHFKNFNDTYGHQLGDEVLRSLAKVIQGSVRDFDYVFRYGGEEIVVLLPYTEHEGAVVLAERLRTWIEGRTLVAADPKGRYPNIRLTVSIGVSTFCPVVEDEVKMVARADEALYAAKKQGRNRVVFSPGPCHKGEGGRDNL
jgi:diguanylate cyclase (GGDEF)-like protein